MEEGQLQFFSGAAPVLLVALVWVIIASCTAWRLGYYSPPYSCRSLHAIQLGGKEVLAIFFLYIGMNVIVFPFLILLSFYLVPGIEDNTNYPLSEGWLHLILIAAVTAALLIYTSTLYSNKKKDVFRLNAYKRERYASDLSIGASSWLVAYPLVLFIGQSISYMTHLLYEDHAIEQVAIQQLRKTFDAPLLYATTIFFIVIVIPFIEELIFRGYLQTWLRRSLSMKASIVVSSLIFAFFHFSTLQGVANIELLTSLFLFSLYLGYIFERQQSLLASTALHATFNAISVFFISITEV